MSEQTYECRPSDYAPEAAVEVRADSPRDAAEAFRAEYDRLRVKPEAESEVIVTNPDGTELTFVVTRSAAPPYTAKVKRSNTEAA